MKALAEKLTKAILPKGWDEWSEPLRKLWIKNNPHLIKERIQIELTRHKN